MQDNRKISLENQIASMLNQVMEDENHNNNEEKLFSSDNEEELEEINKNNMNQINNYSKNRERIFKLQDRIIYTDIPYDITIIEIKKSDDGIE